MSVENKCNVFFSISQSAVFELALMLWKISLNFQFLWFLCFNHFDFSNVSSCPH